MSHLLLVEKNMDLAKMYRSVLEKTGFKIIHFRTYKDLYKNLNGEGFTAIFLDNDTTRRTLDFISKIRKHSKRQIPIYVVLNDNTDQDLFLMFKNITCITKFPNSGESLSNFTKSLSSRSQFKDLLH